MAKLIELRDVYKIYGEGLESEVRALDGVSLDIEKGEFVAVVGQSGSGKSTMMNVLGCLDIPTRGTYRLDGVDVRELSDKELSRIRNKQIGFIFQQYNLISYLTGLENIELAMTETDNAIPKNQKEVAYALLEKFGIVKSKADRLVTKLSGGEQQRVAIARAISTNAEVILADEPTGNLDVDTAAGIVKIFKELAHEDKKCVIAVTHSEAFAAEADVVVRLEKKKLQD